jgi:hypothetical protein
LYIRKLVLISKCEYLWQEYFLTCSIFFNNIVTITCIHWLIIRGFHAQEPEIEIEHYDPIVNISEKFIEDDMMCIGIRQMVIPGKGYYMESGETYTLLIHSPTDD